MLPDVSPATCPQCGEANGLPFVYGFPTPEAVEADEGGEVIIGGCIVGWEHPEYRCGSCGHEWQETLPDPDQSELA